MNPSLYPIFLFIFFGIVADILFIITDHKKLYIRAEIFKGIASCFFIILGLYCSSFQNSSPFSILILVGLILGGFGDLFLNLYLILDKIANELFAMGAVFFLLGHIAYEVALLTYNPSVVLIAIPLSLVLTVIVIFCLFRIIEADKKMLILGAVYLLIISFMLCTSLIQLIQEPTFLRNQFFFPGALLFFISDFILVIHTFGKKKREWLRPINLSAYYVGQILIALSLLFG